jgi:hypothetical protein
MIEKYPASPPELSPAAQAVIDATGATGTSLELAARGIAAAALAQQHPQPIPVSERLPGPEDCDAEGRCWWWRPSHPESGYSEGWMLRPRAWGGGRYDFDDCLMHTQWLPAHALPAPANDC